MRWGRIAIQSRKGTPGANDPITGGEGFMGRQHGDGVAFRVRSPAAKREHLSAGSWRGGTMAWLGGRWRRWPRPRNEGD